MTRPHYAALEAACTGGETEPALWRLAWLTPLLRELETAGWASAQEDPAAAHEAVRECRALACDLEAAMAPVAAEAERRRAEAAQARVYTDDDDLPL